MKPNRFDRILDLLTGEIESFFRRMNGGLDNTQQKRVLPSILCCGF